MERNEKYGNLRDGGMTVFNTHSIMALNGCLVIQEPTAVTFSFFTPVVANS
jgi:hypothetical protein